MRNFKNTKAYEVIAHRVNTKDRTDCYFVEALLIGLARYNILLVKL